MIGKALVTINAGGVGRAMQSGAQDLVVDAPPDIVRPRIAAIGPPGVFLGLWLDLTIGIDEAHLIEQMIEPGALLGKEAGVLLIRAPVLQIDLPVRNVPVTAEHVAAATLMKLAQVRQERLEKANLGS